MSNFYTALKWILPLGTPVVLILFYRTAPLVGEGSLDGLMKFNLAAAVMGLVCLIAFIVSVKSSKGSGVELSTADKGANGMLIAMALICLELGIFGMVGVNMDKNADPKVASMKNCYVQETGFVNHLRGIDSILVCTDPSGSETIFALDKETAEKLGTEKQNLTIEYHGNSNRIIRIS